MHGLKERFIDGMRLAATSVNVVTTNGDGGRAGVTVSAMTPVSADGEAPTLLVCVHHLSAAAAALLHNRRFCVNILRDNQSYISDTFAGRLRPSNDDKFSCTRWETMSGGGLRVRDALAAFDCRLLKSDTIGTHHLLIGETEDVFVANAGNPLIYSNRAYGASFVLRRTGNGGTQQAAFRIGVLHTFGPYLLPPLLRKLRDATGVAEVDVYEGDQRYLLELLNKGMIDAAFLYDLYLEDTICAEPVADFSPYVLLAQDHELAACEMLTLKQLLPHPLVLLDAPPSSDYFLSLFDGVGEPFIAYRAKSFEMVRGMVANGLGYGLLATRPAASVSYDGKPLAAVPLANSLPVSTLAFCRLQNAAETTDNALLFQHCLKWASSALPPTGGQPWPTP